MLMQKMMINHSRKKPFRLGIAYFQRNPLVEDDCLLLRSETQVRILNFEDPDDESCLADTGRMWMM